MKLSLNLEDDQNPQLKAKLPISIFNQPFTSIFSTTTTNSISFSLSTNFPSGPSLKLAYVPSSTTTSTAPFSLSLKSGLGLFGSPHNSPLIFSANFSLSNSTTTPLSTFSLHFKPQLGHFSLHKKTTPSNVSTHDSDSHSYSTKSFNLASGSPSNPHFANGFASNGSSSEILGGFDGNLGWQEVKLEPFNNGKEKEANFVDVDKNANGCFSKGQLVWRDGKKGGFFTGVAVKARTVLPLTRRVMVNLRWGVHLPGDFGVKMPYLTVNKIGIERIEEVKEVKRENNENKGSDSEFLKGMCFWMRRDLELLEKENRDMNQCLEDMRLGVFKRNLKGDGNVVLKTPVPVSSDSFGEVEYRRGKRNDRASGQRELMKPASPVTDLESELQRAIKAASP